MQAATQRTIDASPAFMEYGLAKKITAWAHANRGPNKQEDWVQFCMKRLRTLKSFKIFKRKIKKLKTYSGWCPFKGLSNDTTLMQIQSGGTVPLKYGNFRHGLFIDDMYIYELYECWLLQPIRIKIVHTCTCNVIPWLYTFLFTFFMLRNLIWRYFLWQGKHTLR